MKAPRPAALGVSLVIALDPTCLRGPRSSLGRRSVCGCLGFALIVLLSGAQRNTGRHGAMFTAGDAQQEFRAFLSRRGLAVATLDVAGGSAAMLDFYQDHRPADCAQIPDGDMLLFQWGTYDWGQGEH